MSYKSIVISHNIYLLIILIIKIVNSKFKCSAKIIKQPSSACLISHI